MTFTALPLKVINLSVSDFSKSILNLTRQIYKAFTRQYGELSRTEPLRVGLILVLKFEWVVDEIEKWRAVPQWAYVESHKSLHVNETLA